MPGLTLWLAPDADVAELTDRFQSAQAAMLHAPDYEPMLAVEAAGCRIGHVAYPEYPVRYIRRPPYVIALEGRVFARAQSALDSELTDLAELALHDREASPDALRRWILEHDGDYVIAMTDEAGQRLVLLTDPLGRLPLYLHIGDEGVMLARECKFIARLRGTAEFDRIGWAQYLWIGYPLGPHTTFEGVSRAPGGVYLRAEAYGGRVKATTVELFTCNFDEKDESVPRSRWPADLADAFFDATAASVATEERHPLVLSLSGGFDSRCVGAALKRSGVAFSAATFRAVDRPEHGSAADARIAAQIAAQLGVPWELIRLPEPGEDEARRIVWMTDGLNYMALILGFLEQLVSQFGRGAFFVTGGGGDKALPDRRPTRPVGNSQELVDSVIAEHAVLEAGVAEDIMGLERGTLRATLEEHLSSYPEHDPVQKGVHFKIYERGRKALFQAEDRNRLYLWHTSPFWTFSFFQLAMRVPDQLKSGYALYREFQKHVDPALARIEHAEVGFRVRVPLLGRDLDLTAAARRMPRPLRSTGKRILGRGQGPRAWQRLTEERARQTAQAKQASRSAGDELFRSSVMDPDAVRRMLETASHKQYWDWRTLALLEELWAGASPD